MSKNMKFLRKGALLLAVLAMVLGQCFGMLGGVAAQAANDYSGLVVTGIKLVGDAPTQVMVKGKVTANVQITLKNVGDTAIEAAEEVNLDTAGIVDAYAHYDNGSGSSNGLQTVDNKNLTVTLGKVDLPAIAANGTATVEAVVTIEGKATNDHYGFGVFLVGRAEDKTEYSPAEWKGDYDAGNVPNKYENVYFPVKIVAEPSATGTDNSAYTAIEVYAIDTDTGKVMTTIPSYKFGDQMKNIYVNAYNEKGEKQATLSWDQFEIKTADGTRVKDASDDSAPFVKSKGVTSGYFEAGEVQLIFTTNISEVVGSIVVNIEPADTKTTLELETYNNKTNAYGNAEEHYTADVARVKLVATVTTDAVNAYKFATKTDTGKDEGAVAFYDNGELLATVPLGDVLDEVPVSGGYKKETSREAGKATYAFVAAEGDHVYTAEYVPAGDAAKYLAESEASNEEDLTVGKYTYNYATLTIENTDLLRGEWTDVTLSFDKPVSAGTAEVEFKSTKGDTRTAYFTLNDTDTSYTKTLQFTAIGEWQAKVVVEFQEDTKLQTTNEVTTDAPDTIEKGKPTPITPKYAKDQDGSIRVSQTSTATALEADVTSGEVGDKVKLTAAVTSGTTPVTGGKVQFVELLLKDDGTTEAGKQPQEVNLANGKAEATLTLTAKTVGVYAIYVPNENDAEFTYAGSESDTIDLTVVNQAGSLKVTGPTTPVAATRTATFTVTILGENGYRDTSADGTVTAVTVGEKTFEVDKKVTAGIASVAIPVAELNAGEQTAVVTVKSEEYGTLTGSATFTVAEPVLAATSLSISDDDLKTSATMGDAIASDNITVTVKDRYGIDTYTAATGTVELYLGDALVATAKVNKGIATFKNAKALTAGEDLVLTAKYLGDKAYAASQVTGDEKIDVTKLTTAMTVAVDGSELTINLNVPAGYTPNGKLVITAGETTLATIDAVKAENVVTLANPALAGEQDVTVAFTGDSGMTDATKTVKVTFEAVSGWYENPKGTWYYFKEGEMLANEWVQDGFWYYLGADGVMVKGWKQLEWNGVTDWYYFKTYAPNSGSMMTGWQFLGGKWYYMASSGKMLTGWQQLGGKWYYLDPVNGDMETGWQQLGGKWYYMDPTNGDMKTGWQKVGNTWYYMNASGAMVTGWQRLSWNGVTNWYYFQSSGAMATSGTIDGWNIASSGIATPAN